MSSSFGYKALSLAVATALTATGAHAAGLDRSGQDVTAFLQDGTYAEFVYTYIDADVSGHDSASSTGANSSVETYAKGNPTGDIAEAYDFFRFGVKADVNDRVSVGVLYDEPFGAAVNHLGDSKFTSKSAEETYASLVGVQTATAVPLSLASAVAGDLLSGNNVGAVTKVTQALVQSGVPVAQAQAQATALLQAQGANLTRAATLSNINGQNEGQDTNVEIRTNNLTGLVGVKLGEKRNVQVYAGPALQRLNGEVHLRGTAYQGSTGYDAKISTDNAVGWVAGVAYSKPEIALKAALTYRSEIEHETNIAEYMPGLVLRGQATTKAQPFSVTLPESYNLDFQTGVNPTTLLTAKVRYVPWSDFAIEPPHYGFGTTFVTDNGESLPIAKYSKDQWSAELGLGKKLNDKLAVSGNIGYDSGAGNPTTSLGPIKGYYSVGLGAKYNVTPAWSVSVGGKYLKFGDAHAQLPDGRIAGEFSDNDGYIAGVKLAYQAK